MAAASSDGKAALASASVADAEYFSVFIYNDIKYATTLTSEGISWSRFGEKGAPTRVVSFADMLNVKRDKSNPKAFHIFYCSFAKKQDAKFCAASFTSLTTEEEATTWIGLIFSHIFKGAKKPEDLPKRKLVAVVNPFGGTGTALRIWDSVKSLFRAADVDVEVVKTTHAGHAFEFCNTEPLDRLKGGVFSISGDGVLNECINGLLKRRDWQEAAKVPVGIIPGGSGNGLAASLNTGTPLRAAFAIVKGKTHPLDIWSILYNSSRTFSFLNLEWAMIASVDFESEKARFLGGARFTLWAVKKLIDWEVHKGMLYYLPDEQAPSFDIEPETPVPAPTAASDGTSSPKPASPIPGSPLALSNDEIVENVEKVDLSQHQAAPAIQEFIASPIASPARDHTKQTEEESDKNSSQKLTTVIGPNAATENGPPLKYIPLDAESMKDWRGFAGEFIFFLAQNVTHAATDAQPAPRAKLHDGFCDLVVVRKSTKATMTKVLLGLEEGSHVKETDVDYIKAKAFVLKPEPFKGTVLWGVDGEKMPPAPMMQVEVHPSLIQIFYNPREF